MKRKKDLCFDQAGTEGPFDEYLPLEGIGVKDDG